jgi:hypothetical protein
MRSNSKYIALLFVLVTVIYSCKKVGIPPNTPDNISANFGTVYRSFWAYTSLQGPSVYTVNTVYTQNQNPYQLQFCNLKLLPGYIGTYKLDSVACAVYYLDYYHMPYSFYYLTDSKHTGTFTVSSYNSANNTISGTFSFVGVNFYYKPIESDTIIVTNGVFTNVKL